MPENPRVFSNRRIDWSRIKAVGFDLDHSLVNYHDALHEMTVECVLERLAAPRYGYPKTLDFEYQESFGMRGLVVDESDGAILKLDSHRVVDRAILGNHRLTRNEIDDRYHGASLKVDWSGGDFTHLPDATALPLVHLLPHLLTREKAHGRTFKVMWDDLVLALTDVVNEAGPDPDHETKGMQRKRATANPEKYVRYDPETVPMLEALRQAGRKTFLVSNSEWAWVDAMARQGLGREDWWSLFDFVIVKARKPRFFSEGTPASRVDVAGGPQVIRGGSRRDVEERVAGRGEQILFVCDYLAEETIPARNIGWHSVMVVPELEEEGRQAQQAAQTRAELQRERSGLLAKGHSARSRIVELSKTIRELDQVVDEAGRSPWGSFFRTGTTESYFVSEMLRSACGYTSRASHLRREIELPDELVFNANLRLCPHEL